MLEYDGRFMKRFINRERELDALGRQYAAENASFMVIYGRRRVGKTTLLKEFIKDKNALYFLAEEESETITMKRFAKAVADFTNQSYMDKMIYDDWHDIFEPFRNSQGSDKKIIIYESPLYGRRTGQLKMKQIDFLHYDKFYENLSFRDLVERYAVTGGGAKVHRVV